MTEFMVRYTELAPTRFKSLFRTRALKRSIQIVDYPARGEPRQRPSARAAKAERHIGVARLTDLPAEWSRQYQTLGLPAQ
jgi:hypothetical protein